MTSKGFCRQSGGNLSGLLLSPFLGATSETKGPLSVPYSPKASSRVDLFRLRLLEGSQQ